MWNKVTRPAPKSLKFIKQYNWGVPGLLIYLLTVVILPPNKKDIPIVLISSVKGDIKLEKYKKYEKHETH